MPLSSLNNMQTLQFTKLFNELLAALNKAFPSHSIQFTFETWCPRSKYPGPNGDSYLRIHHNDPRYPHLWETDAIYLEATKTKIQVQDPGERGGYIYRETINLRTIDDEAIEDYGYQTKHITTPSGLNIILALNF